LITVAATFATTSASDEFAFVCGTKWGSGITAALATEFAKLTVLMK
jgi:hypothetical protein